ncbi:uncharacterized protein FOBCDRAFT_146120 [Fusarium oxysporum Fo47]|uniref:uncharacterized protein n=1 Tax=Fusarium oxysporum Fo47 TaxID=660027 RepID=UPI002869964F|nr:uncharacterized protein FOBCDRAFT_146120 [Fusarium oxysporum Fo47]QKD61206.2 hypothetical protein FOBCDRAFT_146120 [Fusarium oxysporum Fo47]
MLILVAGVSGNMGQKLVHSLTSRGHRVRGLGRDASKLVPHTYALLDDFVTCEVYYDSAALDRACAGVDGIICAYGMDPRLQLEGQLLLLRAAERANAYDALVSFRHHVEMTSDIKPIYVFNSIFAETLFSTIGHGHVGPDMPLVWDSSTKTMNIWGTGHSVWYWTTEQDSAEFTAEIIQRNDAAQGGCWNVCSGANSLLEIAKVYEQERDVQVKLNKLGTIDDLREKALKARKEGRKTDYRLYIGWFYQLYAIDGTWVFPKLDNDILEVKTTSLVEFLKMHPDI